MDPATIRNLLERVKSGESDVDAALAALKTLPFADLGYAVVDHHRALRQGVPEVILGEGKTSAQIAGIAQELVRTGQNVLVTRSTPPRRRRSPPRRRPCATTSRRGDRERPHPRSVALVVGDRCQSDLPVAEEAAETLRMLGGDVVRHYDVGVAGIHRLLHKREALCEAGVLIVVAGMEGALASVVGGLVEAPVIAVPTSVGYGASFRGLAALLGMLTSCASGVTVVNIDNGFGAAFAAARVLRAGAGG